MAPEYYIGLMSGTSIDGVDAVLAEFAHGARSVAAAHQPFSPALRAELNALQYAGENELHRAALAANALMDCCAAAALAAIGRAGMAAADVAAIGVHGQTVRHRPDLGYTLQLVNAAQLAEATRITVVADFRSRDVAAGGQGAPLAPGMHAALFAVPDRHRAVINLGGIANITDLPPHGEVRGFDTGPANTLLDAWCERHTAAPFDRDGAWAATGRVVPSLLAALLSDPYFAAAPPKSTGRDRFNLAWLQPHLAALKPPAQAADVQRTLLALTARTVAEAIAAHCAGATEVLLCGGGAHNALLRSVLEAALAPRRVRTTDEFGVRVNEVEALAFAWLAREALAGRAASLPGVTGARGPRILGAVYRT